MEIVIIVQARLNSNRLPNKVLTPIAGFPLLNYLVERLNTQFERSKILIATSDKKNDDRIEEYCYNKKLSCFRGSLNDVSKRMLDAAKIKRAKAFVRINGDSPLIDPVIVQQAISIYQNGKYDLVTNSYPRSYPVGQSVEVINTETYDKTYQKMTKPEDFEHVTKYYYNHPDDFCIKNFSNANDLSGYRLAVDTPEDLDRMKKIIGSMTRPHREYRLDELIELYPSA